MKKFLKFLFTEYIIIPFIAIGFVIGNLYKEGKHAEATVIFFGFLWLVTAYVLIKEVEKKS